MGCSRKIYKGVPFRGRPIWALRVMLTCTAMLPLPRTKNEAPGFLSTSNMDIKPKKVRSVFLARFGPPHLPWAYAKLIGKIMSAICCAALIARQGITFVLDPITARQFIDRGGFDTKEKLIQWAYENATLPAKVYWDDQFVQRFSIPGLERVLNPLPACLRPNPTISSLFSPRRISRRRRGGRNQRLLAHYGQYVY